MSARVNTDLGNFFEPAVELFAIDESDPDKVLTIVLPRNLKVVDGSSTTPS